MVMVKNHRIVGYHATKQVPCFQVIYTQGKSLRSSGHCNPSRMLKEIKILDNRAVERMLLRELTLYETQEKNNQELKNTTSGLDIFGRSGLK